MIFLSKILSIIRSLSDYELVTNVVYLCHSNLDDLRHFSDHYDQLLGNFYMSCILDRTNDFASCPSVKRS